MSNNKVHEKYLPFCEDTLMKHFANTNKDHLKYYKESIKRYDKFIAKQNKIIGKSLDELRSPFQIQKDERFWTINTLLNIYNSQNRLSELVQLFEKEFGQEVPLSINIDSWKDCFDSKNLKLYFEVDLPSTKKYKDYLYNNYCLSYKNKQSNGHQFIPYILACAYNKKRLEGSTQVDAIIINPDNGFTVIFEAKVLSDISIFITYDLLRNQIARNIDVMINEELENNYNNHSLLKNINPKKTLFILLTPKTFKDNPSSRFYGYKMMDYTDKKMGVNNLNKDLPHREKEELEDIPQRIGWLTWQDFKDVNSNCSPFDIDYNTFC